MFKTKKLLLAFICSSSLFSNALYAQQCDGDKPSLTPNSRYQILNKGSEVKDLKTGLTWQRCVVGENWDGRQCVGSQIEFSNEDAKKFINVQAQNWRLPTINELLTLSSVNCWEPAINTIIFPFNPNRGSDARDTLRSSIQYHENKIDALDTKNRYGKLVWYWAFSTAYGDKSYETKDLPMRLVRK